jgi:hypothetical protein
MQRCPADRQILEANWTPIASCWPSICLSEFKTYLLSALYRNNTGPHLERQIGSPYVSGGYRRSGKRKSLPAKRSSSMFFSPTEKQKAKPLNQKPRQRARHPKQLFRKTPPENFKSFAQFLDVGFRSRFFCKTSDAMLSEPNTGTKSFWRRSFASHQRLRHTSLLQLLAFLCLPVCQRRLSTVHVFLKAFAGISN